MSETIVTSGFAELERALLKLPEKLQGAIGRQAIGAGARVIRDIAKGIVSVKTGALRDSIRVSTRRSKTGEITAAIRAGGRFKKRKVEQDSFYAHMVEYGTRPHYIKPKRAKALYIDGKFVRAVTHPGAKAKPFMRPALDQGASRAIDAVAAQMRARLNDLAK